MKFRDALAGAWRRPAIHVETLLLLGAVFLMLAVNGSFWRAALAGSSTSDPATWLYAGAIFAAFTAFYFAAAALVAGRHTAKPLLTVLFMISAVAAYYMDRYGVYFDREMVRNVFATDYHEARDLLSGDLALYLLAFGVVPSILVWRTALKRRPLGRAVAVRLGWIAAALVAGAASLLLVFADFASLMRNHKEVRYLLTPGNLIAASAGSAWGHAKRPGGQARITVGADAKLGAAWGARPRPALFVLVVGETARARNFALNGYARQTNPQLARLDVINFPKARACGTSTEVSLPCMFSPFGRSRYDEEKILSHESVLHVLARAGLQVLWRDNQSGCKGVCDGLPAQPGKAEAGALCGDDQCLDEVLLQGMEGMARDKQGNLFVVMHQLGSHGPAYFKRYPPAFKRFTPACETEDLRHCTQAEIVNAYDNSLLYTDFVLGKVIDFLKKAEATHDTAMLYVSDHGESLGENGLYLHGVPYSIAPDVQLDVPFLMWLSPAFRRAFGINQECMRKQTSQAVSHDNLFHSLLGVLDVQTTAYEPALDLFAPCRSASAGSTR